MKNTKDTIKEAKASAVDLYAAGQFFCSEAVLYTINRCIGNPLPVEIVRLSSGFAGGIGKSGHVCGALTGGVMALGLAFGRTEPGVKCPKLHPATRELLEWFDLTYRSTSCEVLRKKESPLKNRDTDMCLAITGETAARTMELVLKYEKMSSSGILLRKVRQSLKKLRE